MGKKIIALLLSFVSIFSLVLYTSASEFMLGDVDGDGKHSAADARLALRASVSLETLSAEAFAAADIDNNKIVSANDARTILRASVGLERLGRDYYKLKEIWTEDGNWEFSFFDVKPHNDCSNIFVGKNEACYTLQFRYKNLGKNDNVIFTPIRSFMAYAEDGTEVESDICTHSETAIYARKGEEMTATVHYIVPKDCKELRIVVRLGEDGNSIYSFEEGPEAEFRIDLTYSCTHKWINATCLTAKYCSLCLETQGTALGHTGGKNKYCIRCNVFVGDIYPILGAPLDTMDSLKAFLPSFYSRYCYMGGNFRILYDTADGIYLSWGAQNKSAKTIKYITVNLDFYNKFGAPVRDEISGKTSTNFQVVGPIEPGKHFYLRHNICYSDEIAYVVMGNVTVEFMDGTKVKDWYGYRTNAPFTQMSGSEYLYIED